MIKTTQIDDIEKYLKTHKRGITSIEAFERFGATRLSGVIWQLKKRRKMKIKAEYEQVSNRYGSNARVARYYLCD